MIPAERSCLRSRRLLLSSQALAFSTTERTAPSPEPCSEPILPDQRLDALAQAEPAIVGAVVAGIGEEARDPGADHQGEAQQFGEHPGVVDIRGRGHRAQRQSVARDDDVILGAALAPVGRVRPGQFAAVLGPDAATVDDHVQARGRRLRDRTAPCAAARHEPAAAPPYHAIRATAGAGSSRTRDRRGREVRATGRLRAKRTVTSRPLPPQAGVVVRVPSVPSPIAQRCRRLDRLLLLSTFTR